MADRNSASPPPETFFVVEDVQQARLLSDPRSVRFFEPFLGRERTVSQAADEVGVSLDTMLYRVRRLLAAGLLRVVREESRPGRAIKVYRSTSDAYFVPFHSTPYADLAERLREELGPFLNESSDLLARLLTRLGVEGRRIFRTAEGEVWQDASDAAARRFDPDATDLPPVEWTTARVRLREDDAREMLHEMRAVWRRLHERQAPADEGAVYRTMIMLVPEEGG